MTGNKVMRLKNNPNGRGFLVSVLEETDRLPELGIINFKVVESVAAGTRRKADRVYDELRTKHGIKSIAEQISGS